MAPIVGGLRYAIFILVGGNRNETKIESSCVKFSMASCSILLQFLIAKLLRALSSFSLLETGFSVSYKLVIFCTTEEWCSMSCDKLGEEIPRDISAALRKLLKYLSASFSSQGRWMSRPSNECKREKR